MNKFEKIRFCVLKALLTAFACLPTPVLLAVSRVLCLVVGGVVRYRRRVVLGNLRRSFPDKSQDEIRRIARGFYQHLCDLIVESVKLLHISDAELAQRIEVLGGEGIEEMSKDGRPVIAFLGHYGNWEWVQQVTRHYRRPAVTAEVYRPIKNSVVDALMMRLRGRFDTTLIPQKQAVRHLLQMDRDGVQFLVGFVADQRPNSKHLYHWTDFLSQDTPYAVGGEEIGRRMNAHFVYIDVEKPARGYYRMTFRPIRPENTDVEYPCTLEYMRLLEQRIRHAPEYWLWSHNRWKYDRQGRIIHR
ncbi:MAG: lysophospholipid acyltransferase family protein [Bacteroidaceae bacterium]|nr:lysophospholipid acyltransferase family protein [Bacteroidaceae bacterium]